MSETATSREIVKKGKNYTLYADGTIRLRGVRASYPHLAKPQENKGDDGSVSTSYSLTCLLPKKEFREAKDVIKGMMDGILKDNKIKAIPPDRKFIKDGDATGKDENEGMWIVTAREKKQPRLRSNRRDPATKKAARVTSAEAEEMFYGGCYVSVLLRPWWQNNKYGKRINANLIAVQFVRDGEPFGEGRLTDDAIDDTFDEDLDDETGFEGDEDDDDL